MSNNQKANAIMSVSLSSCLHDNKRQLGEYTGERRTVHRDKTSATTTTTTTMQAATTTT